MREILVAISVGSALAVITCMAAIQMAPDVIPFVYAGM